MGVVNEASPGFELGLDLTAADTANGVDAPYVVLARKYRPKDFSTLIGQDALVRTLSNAFAQKRLAHAFLLTGVRGVGKTTSARILAKAFNCVGPDGDRTEPTPEPCGQCPQCKAITEDRHVDVLEIDAASNNGVDYIRELQGELHYKPVQGRYRVYIVDEVHMLSTSAFNAFLKTLEEPPGHVKFIFATTEANKLPVTIRSRCQRFDLRRVGTQQLKEHYAHLAQLEGIDVDDDALSLVAQAADGSVRDGLSMLDQAISLASTASGGRVTAQSVRDMLGLNDGGRLMSLFTLIHQGATQEALDLFDTMFADGTDPLILARELAQQTHLVTRRKIIGEQVASLMNDAEKEFLAKMASGLNLGALNRTWELLIKGLDELRDIPHPKMSFDMLLVRLCHVARMPDPDALLKQLDDAQAGLKTSDTPPTAVSEPQLASTSDDASTDAKITAGNGPTSAISTPADPSDDLDASPLNSHEHREAAEVISTEDESSAQPMPETFDALVRLLEDNRLGLLATHMSEDVRPVSLKGARLRIRLTDRAPRNLPRTLASTLQQLTDTAWDVGLSDEDGDQPLGEQRRLARAKEYHAVKNHPAVAKALATFPDAEIHDIRFKQSDEDSDANTKTLH